MLWRCRLGGRKGIRPVKSWVVGCWSEVHTCIWTSWCHSLSLASVKSRLVLPFWQRLTRVVQDKGPLNGCVCVCCNEMWYFSGRKRSTSLCIVWVYVYFNLLYTAIFRLLWSCWMSCFCFFLTCHVDMCSSLSYRECIYTAVSLYFWGPICKISLRFIIRLS